MKTRKAFTTLLLSAFWIVPAAANTRPAPPSANLRNEDAMLDGAAAGTIGADQLHTLAGMTVTGANDRTLGTVAAVDENNQTVQLKPTDGQTITMPSALFWMQDGQLMAPTTGHLDVLAMAALQNGNHQLAYRVSQRRD